jgi:hypothetical protein
VPERIVLSAAQQASFEERGLLHLPGLVPAPRVAALRERILAYFDAHGLVPSSVPPGFAVRPSRTAGLVKALGFAETWTPRVPRLLDSLLGEGAWRMPRCAGQLLAVTYPLPEGVWRLPHQVWHLDYMAPGAVRTLPGSQVFLCVDRVAPRAGGTLVACGTHRLIDALRLRAGPEWPGRSAEVRKRLRAETPWFRALCSLRAGEDREARFMARADEAGLQVVELAGEAGDVFVMHPWLLHAPSENQGAAPRLVLTERVRSVDAPW